MNIVKKIVIIFLGTCCFFYEAISQKVLKELTLNYNISIESVDEDPALSKSLDGATLSVSIKGSDSRADMISSLGSESNLYDSKTGKGFILKEYSGQKLMITMNRENWMQKNKYFQNLKFNIDNK